MVDTREIFWNVGPYAITAMYLLAIAAAGLLVAGFVRLSGIWRLGRPADRFGDPIARLLRFLGDTLSQRRVVRVPDGGAPHAVLFWGFLVLLAGTLLVLLQADVITPLFRVNLLQGLFYRLFSVALDLAGALALLALIGLFFRRYVHRPDGLVSTREDLLGHGLLFSILFSGFLVEGARMAVTELPRNPALARWSPVGYLAAIAMRGMDGQLLMALHQGFWWGHLLLGLGFIAVLPRTKLRHIITAGANSYLAPRADEGRLETIDLEDEGQERFGATSPMDLTWKDLYDADACMLCKRCQERCPAWVTGKPLSPMQVIRQIGEAARQAPSGDMVASVTPEVLWACTTCGACQEICPASIEHVGKIVGMRRSLALMQGEFPGPEVRRSTEAVEVQGNPFGLAPSARAAWAEGLPASLMSVDSRVDLLYFAGCYASYDPRNRRVAQSFVRLCAAAGLKVGILGPEERCCGEPVRKLGNEYLYQATAADNIAAFRKYGVDRIVTTCPHCFSTLGSDYRDLGFTATVEHHATFLARLVAEGRLKVDAVPFGATFHDPCTLARYHGIVDEPRTLLEAAGARVSEMEAHGNGGFCCGGGGGRILAEERIGRRIAAERLRMAERAGMPLLASACPFCLSMFEENLPESGTEMGGMQVRDIAELLVDRVRN